MDVKYPVKRHTPFYTPLGFSRGAAEDRRLSAGTSNRDGRPSNPALTTRPPPRGAFHGACPPFDWVRKTFWEVSATARRPQSALCIFPSAANPPARRIPSTAISRRRYRAGTPHHTFVAWSFLLPFTTWPAAMRDPWPASQPFSRGATPTSRPCPLFPLAC